MHTLQRNGQQLSWELPEVQLSRETTEKRPTCEQTGRQLTWAETGKQGQTRPAQLWEPPQGW